MLYELAERPRILLIGADGQLGWELRRTASPLGDVLATVENDSRRRNVAADLLDLADHGAIRRVVAEVKPHVILNAAAFTDIDQTEREPAIATAINGVAPGVLAREAARYGALLVHYSTDNVFDGELDRPYSPSDPPRPANTYGHTKLQGEDAIRAIGGPHLILRTSWLYGSRGNNFLMTVLDLVDAGRPISVVSDQFGAPTWTRSVASATVQILSLARVAGAGWMRERFGTYHMTAGGRCSWYEFAAAILERFREGDYELAPQSTSSYPASAGRPANGVLDCAAVRRAFGIVLDDWRISLERVMEEVREVRRPPERGPRARSGGERPRLTGWRRGGPGAGSLGVRFAPVLAAAVAGLGSEWAAATAASVDRPTSMPLPLPVPAPVHLPVPAPKPLPVPMPEDEAKAMAGTERYCVGYERTFHGEWENGADRALGGPPVLFRIGANPRGAGCYAQLNMRTPPGVAPYELPRFQAKAKEGGTAWMLRYREIVLEFDTKSGAVVRREGGNAVRNGILLVRPPALGEPPPAPPARQRERWYGKWRGRISGLPFPVTLRFSPAERGRVRGRISMLLKDENSTGRFHGEMLVFRWRNRHVALHMEPGGDTLVYNDYRGRVFRFRRRR